MFYGTNIINNQSSHYNLFSMVKFNITLWGGEAAELREGAKARVSGWPDGQVIGERKQRSCTKVAEQHESMQACTKCHCVATKALSCTKALRAGLTLSD